MYQKQKKRNPRNDEVSVKNMSNQKRQGKKVLSEGRKTIKKKADWVMVLRRLPETRNGIC